MDKGVATRRKHFGIVCGVILTLFAVSVNAGSAINQIVVVKSSDNSYFNQTVETLINHVDQAISFKVVLQQDLAQFGAEQSQQSLFVALGYAAAEAVNEVADRGSAINAYLTLEQYRQLQPEQQVTALLDQPLYRYLLFSKLILPLESVGMMTEEKIRLNPRENQLLRQMNFKLEQYQVDPANKLLPVLRKLLSRNDALLMLPRQSIYNRDTLKGVLLTSYRNRKPAISYSPAHVKSGALASIYSSPVDIGRHLSRLVNRRLSDPESPFRGFEFAEFFSIATNGRVARALGISLPSENEIRSSMESYRK